LNVNIKRRSLVCTVAALALVLLLAGTFAGCGEQGKTTVPQTGTTNSGQQGKVQLLLFTQPG
jgi:predicted small lipoprotein YifL